MKKRTILIPALLLPALMGCSDYEEKKNDTKNTYKTLEDCLDDNPKDKAGDNPCEKIANGGGSSGYYVGPGYPYGYYGHSGFYQGYWLGRMTTRSYGVVQESGVVMTHSSIMTSGGKLSAPSSVSARGTSISRGGFGSSGHSGFGGS